MTPGDADDEEWGEKESPHKALWRHKEEQEPRLLLP